MEKLIYAEALKADIRNRKTYLSYEDAKDVIDLIDRQPAARCINADNLIEFIKAHYSQTSSIKSILSYIEVNAGGTK